MEDTSVEAPRFPSYDVQTSPSVHDKRDYEASIEGRVRAVPYDVPSLSS